MKLFKTKEQESNSEEFDVKQSFEQLSKTVSELQEKLEALEPKALTEEQVEQKVLAIKQEFEGKLSEFANKAAKDTAKQLASIGHSAVTTETEENDPKEVMRRKAIKIKQEFEGMTPGKERAEFRRKNESLLTYPTETNE
jgi:hypothetical protein